MNEEEEPGKESKEQLLKKEEQLKEWFTESIKRITSVFGGDCFLLFEIKNYSISLKSVASDTDKMSFTLAEVNEKKKEDYFG